MTCLDAWVEAFDRLSEAIENWDSCCQGQIDTVPPAAEDITGVDDSDGAPTYDREGDEHPPAYADPAAYDAYLCGVAHRFADKTDEAVDTVFDIILTASNILVFATLVVLAFGNVISMGIAAVLAGGYSLVSLGEVFGFFSAMTELREALGGGDPGGLVPQTKAELNAVYDDIVDAIFCANDAPEATANLHAVLDAEVTNSSYRALLKLTMNGLVMRAAFAGFVNVPDRFDCTCGGTLFSELTVFGTNNDGLGNWFGGGTTDAETQRYAGALGHSLNLVRSLPAGYRVAGNTIRLTLTNVWNVFSSDQDLYWRVSWDAVDFDMQEVGVVKPNPGEQVVIEHEISGTDLSDVLEIRLGTNSGTNNHRVDQILLEILE